MSQFMDRNYSTAKVSNGDVKSVVDSREDARSFQSKKVSGVEQQKTDVSKVATSRVDVQKSDTKLGASRTDLRNVDSKIGASRTSLNKIDNKPDPKVTSSRVDLKAAANGIKSDIPDIEITKCPICKNDAASPKVLPCLHTFCEVCISNHVANALTKGRSAQIQCPVCVTPVATPKPVTDAGEFAMNLPTNHFISSLMVQNQVQTKQCKPCQKLKKSTPAVSWCSYCAETLCPEHDSYHRSLTSGDIHQVSRIDDIKEDKTLSYAPGICQKHPTEKLKYYCETHKEPCCELCRRNFHRMCDDTMTVDKAADELKNHLDTANLARMLESINTQTSEIVDGRKDNIKELEAGKAKESQTIRKFRQLVDDHLNTLENNLKEELERKHKQKVSEINKEIDVFETKQQTIAFYKSLLNSILKKGSGIQVLTELNKVGQQCAILEEKIQHRATKLKRVNYELKQNDVTLGMESLGTVDFKQSAIAPASASEDWHKLRGKKSVAKNTHHYRENTHDFLVIRYSSSRITGGATLRNLLVLVDHTAREIRGYTVTGHREESLTFTFRKNPWDVVCLPNRDGVEMMAVTLPDENVVQLLICGESPTADKYHYQTRKNCYGITYSDGHLIIASGIGLEVAELIEDHKMLFRSFLKLVGDKIHYVCAGDKNRVYYTDSSDKGSLYCITLDGTEIFSYSHDNLRAPRGISTDTRGNVYVAGNHSNNIHMVSPDGTLVHIISPKTKTFYKPIVLIEHEEKMYSVFGKHKVIVFA